MNSAAIFAIGMVFAGCCSNVVFLELLIRQFPGSGNIVTFMQFLFIGLEGFIFAAHFGTKKSVIPIRKYLIMVMFFFTVSVVNNYAMNFNISTPLQMIFRSGSLVANMALGILILKKQYPPSKFLSVFMISIGIFVCTLMSARTETLNASNGGSANGNDNEENMSDEEAASAYIFRMLIGVAMLTFGLFLSARMGIFQEVLYKEFGKHPREALFYSHALPLPGFLLLGQDIYNHAVMFSASEPVNVPLLEADVPKMWLFLIGNIVTQYVCIRGVFILTTECPSLVVTLVVTLRKFVSLVFSIVYFQNPFTIYHWFGTFLVFGGTLLFTGVFQTLYEIVVPPTPIEKKTD
ncbi:UDP-xylose and UDP-N-acetylglucosamine transporter-like [Amphiura filiformis]|uniref:UDP-xylose and UDP-N-acetylglucosamine transporter-like n=1 Tax=Amphiura filiformis TaxID=82378 RepID=UPI003B225BA7